MAINSRLISSSFISFHQWSSILLEIMYKDPNFSENYVYTGLISETKQITDAYWFPRNISVCLNKFVIEMKIVV